MSEQLPSPTGAAGDAREQRRVEGARRLAASSVIQTVGQVGSKVAVLLLYAVMARTVGRDDFGDFVSATSLALLVFIAEFGVDYTTTRLVARDDPAAGTAFWNALLTKVGLGILFVAGVCGVGLAGGYSDQAVLATLLLGAATIVEMLTMTLYAVFRGIDRTGTIAQGQLLQRWSVAGAGVAVMLLGGGVVSVAAVWLAGAVLGLAYVTWRSHALRVVPSGRVAPRDTVSLLRDSFGLGLSAVFGAALSRLDVVILGLLKPSLAVALYGAAYRVFESSLLIMATFALASFPMLARIGKDDPAAMGRAFGRLVKIGLVITAPVTLLLILLADPIVRAFYGGGYADAASVLALLAPGVVLTGIFGLACNVLAAQKRQGPIVACLSAGAVINTALNLVLIPPHGAEGAAVAMTATMTVTTTALVLVVRSATGPLQVRRNVLGPVVASAVATAAGIAIGAPLLVVPVAGVAFVAALLVTEQRVAPGDLALAGQVLRRRGVTA